ncbi:hypothetical protein BDR26DRAFT_863292 [Obelidium mucronatum]|nr:hypothetical protein BDR26DRAFT_863292 [Obelidium mucronatum]
MHLQRVLCLIPSEALAHRLYSTGRGRLPSADLLRQLQIPSFKEFRLSLKEQERARMNSFPKTAKPNLKPISRTPYSLSNSSLSKETQALLTAKVSSSSSGLTELELDAIHSLLSTDVASHRRLPANSTHRMLDTDDMQLLKVDDNYISQFPVAEIGTTREEREIAKLSELTAEPGIFGSGSMDSMSVVQITKVIRVNALMGRVKEAEDAFLKIRANGLVPDTFAINTLMDAYARIGDYRNAARVFKEFHNKESPETLNPDLVSYGILIKACVYAGKLKSAFDVYESMKQKGLNPSLQIYTTLIKGCIDTKDLPRAWKTFNHMYEEICQPNATTYSLMIHACALDNNPERALELFRQMHERGLVATEVTYTSLLQACGSRKDYYSEVWGLVGQMVDQGWKVNLVACKVLMNVCATQGDLGRLRTVWNWAIAQAANGDESMKPDASVYRNMFHALGQCVRVARRTSKRTTIPISAQRSSSPYADEDDTSTPSLLIGHSPEKAAGIQPKSSYTFIEPVIPQHSLQHIHLSNTEVTVSAIMADAACLWNNALVSLEKAQVTSPLVDSYLAIYCATPGNIIAASKALEIFDTFYDKPRAPTASTENAKDANISVSLACDNSDTRTDNEAAFSNESVSEAHSSLIVPKTGWTYHSILDIVSKDKKLMNARGVEIWNEYLRWDAERESSLVGCTPTEKEAIRVSEGRGREAMKKSFAFMIRGYSKINDISRALDTIEAASTFRDDPSYLPAISFDDVSSLVDKVRDLAEEGNLAPAKRLKELCPPPPPKTAAEEVKQMLKNKWTGGNNWWGWESLGIDENVRRKVIRKQQKEADRVKAYWKNKR